MHICVHVCMAICMHVHMSAYRCVWLRAMNIYIYIYACICVNLPVLKQGLTVYPRLALDSQFSCFRLLNAGIIDLGHNFLAESDLIDIMQCYLI